MATDQRIIKVTNQKRNWNCILIPFRFGVCCLFLYKTGSEDVSQNCSYIQNPNYPSAYGSTTSIYWNVKKCSKGLYLHSH